MAWQLLSGGGTRDCPARWQKWVDLDRARSHVSALRYLVGMDTRIGSLHYDEQLAKTQALYDSIAGLSLSLDMEPLDAWPYSPERLNFYYGDKDVPGLYDSQHEPVWPAGVRMADSFRELPIWQTMREHDGGRINSFDAGDTHEIVPWLRVDVGTNGKQLTRTQPPDPECHDGEQASGPSSWSDYGWTYCDHTGPFRDTAYSNHTYAVLLPLKVSWDLGVKIARMVLDVSIQTVIDKSLVWMLSRDVALAHAIGGPDATLDIIARTTEESAEAAGHAELNRDLNYAGIVVALAQSVPVAGQIIGIVYGVVRALAAVVPMATASAYDVWGRREWYAMSTGFHHSGHVGAKPQEPAIAAPEAVEDHTVMLAAAPVVVALAPIEQRPSVAPRRRVSPWLLAAGFVAAVGIGAAVARGSR